MSELQKVAQDFAMSEFSLVFVLQKKTRESDDNMAKIQLKSERLPLFERLFGSSDISSDTCRVNNQVRIFKNEVQQTIRF